MQIGRTDMRASNHCLVWLELGRASKHSRKGKCVIKSWRIERLIDGMVGSRLVKGVLAD